MSATLNRLLAWTLILPALLCGQEPSAQPDLTRATAQYEEAAALCARSSLAKALPLAQAALATRERALAPSHIDVAWSLTQVGRIQAELSAYDVAGPLLRRATGTFQALGDRRGEAAAAVGLMWVHDEEPESAKAWIAKAQSLFRAAGDRTGEAEALHAEGAMLTYQNLALEGRDRLEKALALAQGPALAGLRGRILNTLGAAQVTLGNHTQGFACFEEALPLHQAAGDLLSEGEALNNRGMLHYRRLELPQALADLERSLVLFRQEQSRLGQAQAHNALALVLDALGQSDRAKANQETALELNLALNNRAAAATILFNIGTRQEGLREDAQARATLERCLEWCRQVPAKSVEGLALALLSRIHRRGGRFEQAQACLDQALALHRSIHFTLGEALDLNALGDLRLAQGRALEALPLLEQALIKGRAISNRTRELSALASLARALQAAGRAAESTQRHQELATAQDRLRVTTFPVLSEAQKLTYSLGFEQARHEFIAHALASAKEAPHALRGSFDAWLAHKGAVLDAEERIQESILRSRDPKVRALGQALTRMRLQLAAAQERPKTMPQADHDRQLKELQTQCDAQEEALARASRLYALGAASARMDAPRLAVCLPKGAVYIDFARIRTFDLKENRFVPPRYAAYVLRLGAADSPEAGGFELSLLDLGPAEPLDAQVQALHQAIQAGRPLSADLAVLQRRLLGPMAAQLAGASAFIISPAGALNLMPFEILPTNDGQPLMDQGPVSYVTSGRDLARFSDLGRPAGPLAILDDPDFDLGLSATERQGAKSTFPRLPGTRAEARAVAGAFGQRARKWEGARASKQTLLGLKSPWGLHLATHGYFLPSPPPSGAIDLTGTGITLPGLENPMLRSGLALAGANASPQGLMSAEKLRGLDLSTTSLVVLSACNTGRGGVQDSEGLFGLRRAFMLAGAQTLVVSLWPVPDAETQQLMGLFYRGLARGQTKAAALSQAKRRMRQKHPHPRAWAGFVLVGNPR